MKKTTEKLIFELIKKYPNLEFMSKNIEFAINEIVMRLKNGGKVLVCGNGGSSSDSEHIVGELLKDFYIKRDLDNTFSEKLKTLFPEDFMKFNKYLQGGIPAISLVSQTGFLTAFGNDAKFDMAYAQQVYVYGNENDVLLALSTSGNSKNVINAAKVAKLKDIFILSLTGYNGGGLKDISDVLLNAPSDETYEIQEYHLPLYHLICRALENEIFGEIE